MFYSCRTPIYRVNPSIWNLTSGTSFSPSTLMLICWMGVTHCRARRFGRCTNNFSRERTIYGVSSTIYRTYTELPSLKRRMTLRGMWNASSFPCAMTMDRSPTFPNRQQLPHSSSAKTVSRSFFPDSVFRACSSDYSVCWNFTSAGGIV